jgi:glycosyltransferase involved in cell wall biosynthesis
MSLRILLDATALPPSRGGVARYVFGLTSGLASIGADQNLVIVAQRRDIAEFARIAPQARLLPAPAAAERRPIRLAWEQSGLARAARHTRADVMHSPHYSWPVAAGRPVVVTVHDATFFSDPAMHTPLKRTWFRGWTRAAARKASVLIVPSATTRDEIVRFTDAHPERFVIAPHGVDRRIFHPPTLDAVSAFQRAHGLGDQGWVAFLGTIEPRKNVPALVRAFANAVDGRTGEQPALVVAGGAGWDTSVEAAIKSVASRTRVLRTGYLPEEQLSALLGGALVAAYPSLGEGFGLPVLEAMACGAAVLTTRRLALPEVGGDAVAYTEPEVASIAAALRALLDDPERRHALSRAALKRSQSFTWEACARIHLEAYERAAGERISP